MRAFWVAMQSQKSAAMSLRCWRTVGAFGKPLTNVAVVKGADAINPIPIRRPFEHESRT